MANRRLRTLRPPTVRFRARNPCFRFLFRCEGWYSVPRAANRTGSWNSSDRVMGGVLWMRKRLGRDTGLGASRPTRRAAFMMGRGDGGRRRAASKEGGIRGMWLKTQNVTRHATSQMLCWPQLADSASLKSCPIKVLGLPPASGNSFSTFSATRTMFSCPRRPRSPLRILPSSLPMQA